MSAQEFATRKTANTKAHALGRTLSIMTGVLTVSAIFAFAAWAQEEGVNDYLLALFSVLCMLAYISAMAMYHNSKVSRSG